MRKCIPFRRRCHESVCRTTSLCQHATRKHREEPVNSKIRHARATPRTQRARTHTREGGGARKYRPAELALSREPIVSCSRGPARCATSSTMSMWPPWPRPADSRRRCKCLPPEHRSNRASGAVLTIAPARHLPALCLRTAIAVAPSHNACGLGKTAVEESPTRICCGAAEASSSRGGRGWACAGRTSPSPSHCRGHGTVVSEQNKDFLNPYETATTARAR